MLNKYMIMGNLGQDPELNHTGNGTAVCNLSVATNRKWKDRDDKLQEETTWHRVVVWGKNGENCHEYLSKGSKVFVEGRFQSREYEDKDGNKRYSAECVADRVVFLGKNEGGGGKSAGAPPPSDDDIPF